MVSQLYSGQSKFLLWRVSFWLNFKALLFVKNQRAGSHSTVVFADASTLLVNKAQLNYLVDKIKAKFINEQIIKLEVLNSIKVSSTYYSQPWVWVWLLWSRWFYGGVSLERMHHKAEGDPDHELGEQLRKRATVLNATANQKTIIRKDTFSDAKTGEPGCCRSTRKSAVRFRIQQWMNLKRYQQIIQSQRLI